MKLPMHFAWMIRFADRLIARAKRTPFVHLDGYMNRWWLFRIGEGKLGGAGDPHPWLAARIHEILRSDNERDLHDHPWPYLTIILKGGYTEYVPYGQGEIGTWYGAGSVLLRMPWHKHRLELPAGATATTLFITGPKFQTWGFHTEQGKVDYTAYDQWKDGAKLVHFDREPQR